MRAKANFLVHSSRLNYEAARATKHVLVRAGESRSNWIKLQTPWTDRFILNWNFIAHCGSHLGGLFILEIAIIFRLFIFNNRSGRCLPFHLPSPTSCRTSRDRRLNRIALSDRLATAANDSSDDWCIYCATIENRAFQIYVTMGHSNGLLNRPCALFILFCISL